MVVPNQSPVIVIGGSLVGLASALFLSARKVPLILLERHTASSPHPRAIGYTTRTLELLQGAGIPSSSLRAGPTSGGGGSGGGPPRRIKVTSLAGEWANEQHWSSNKGGKPEKGGPSGGPHPDKKPGAGPGPGGPTTPGGKTYAPIMGTAIAQDRLEPILRQRAVDLGADLRLGWEVTGWSQTADGVSVTAVSAQGEQATFEGSYIVACDGAASRVRAALGIATHGVGRLRGVCSVLFRCAPMERFLGRGFAQFSIEGRDDGVEAFLTTYGDGRWALMWSAEEDAARTTGARAQRDLVRAVAGLGEDEIADDDVELLAIGYWELGARIAERFSDGRVFLAGDAAHTLPPNRGGYGANTGFADAHNLAWKIAAVREGAADPAILATYDEERRPVAMVRHDQLFARDDYKPYVRDREWSLTRAGASGEVPVLDDIAMELGQIYLSSGGVVLGVDGEGLPDALRPDEWAGQPGTRAPHMPLTRGGEEISSLDLFGAGWILLSEDGSWKGVAERAGAELGVGCEFVHVGVVVKEADEKETFAANFGVGGTGAVLVRPDGFIAWRVAEKGDDTERVFLEAFAKVSFARK
ncbi:hypothetical protein EsH8_V_000961 [Colletotrichum jinshuiense]